MAEALPLVFRNLSRETSPAAGELWISAAEEHGDCRALALLTLDHGPGAFRRGGADVRCIVVHHDPTLDDMLAAELARKQLAEEPIAPGYRGFARYAAMVREGLRPSEAIPVEDSLEGVFLFIRTEAGRKETHHSLADPEAARRFLPAWSRMADRIALAASDADFDPLNRSPLTGDPEFGRVRSFLVQDRSNFRDDVRRGLVFKARLPEVADCAALLLREPKSLLFRYWFRDDPEAPGGEGYRFLIVDWGHGQWVVSTDPRRHISLQVLAERLQASEPVREDGVAGQWFDGRPFRHTLIAAPHGGSRLTEKQFLRIVRGWASLKSAKPQPAAPQQNNFYADSWKKYVAMFFVPVIGAVTNFVLMRYGSATPKAGLPPTVVTAPPTDTSTRGVRTRQPESNALPPNASAEHPFAVPDDMKDGPLALRLIYRGPGGAPPNIAATVDGVPYRLSWDPARTFGSERWTSELKLEPLPAGPIVVSVQNPSPAPLRYSLQPDWDTGKRTLYVLSVGVSEYRHRPRLPCAAKDARDLEAALRQRYAGAFNDFQSRVRTVEARGDPAVTREQILADLRWLVANARPGDLVVVTLAGHGDLHDLADREFFFLLPESDPKQELGAHALSWNEISRYLSSLKCSALVVNDCCHSGGILRGGDSAELANEVQRALGKLDRLPRGILYLAACQADEAAQENSTRWGHGALTLGLLEFLHGQAIPNTPPTPGLPSGSQVLYLHDMAEYAVRRVKELTGRGQSAEMRPTENFKSQWVPLGVLKKE